MMTTIESCIRIGQGKVRQWVYDPGCRRVGKTAALLLSGLILSAASLAHAPMPLTLGLVCSMSGGNSVLTALGGALGYLLFWGKAGYQGLLWMVLGLAAALGLGKRRILDESPLLMSALAGLIVSASGLAFQIFFRDATPVPTYLLRVLLGALSAKLFEVVRDRRDRYADWIAMGCAVLSLSQVAPFGFSFGYVAAGAIAAWGTLPATALAGLALDLAQLSRTSMTAVLCLAYLMRLVPVGERWLRYASPGITYLFVMHLSGNREFLPALPLALGGCLALGLPQTPPLSHRRGETGLAQVRLELMAQVLAQTQQLLLEEREVPIDKEALLLRIRERACGGCPNRKNCADRRIPLPGELLFIHLGDVSELPVSCKKPGRLILELRRTQEQYRQLQADRQRQGEYRSAVIQQYRFLSDFLQQQSELLPRRRDRLRQRFTPVTAIRSAGREAANGDRCTGFMGTGCRYYIVLCDGMGTGLGAQEEGQTALHLLRQMLIAGFPGEYALRSLNSLLVLRGRAGAVTVDLAEVCLDSGRVTLYKWGAAPSYLLRSGGTEKIGTATPPPGLSVTEGRETVERLSLRRGEALIMVSDGVDAEAVLRRMGRLEALPPERLAAKLVEQGAREIQDDATAAVVRLTPDSMATSYHRKGANAVETQDVGKK